MSGRLQLSSIASCHHLAFHPGHPATVILQLSTLSSCNPLAFVIRPPSSISSCLPLLFHPMGAAWMFESQVCSHCTQSLTKRRSSKGGRASPAGRLALSLSTGSVDKAPYRHDSCLISPATSPQSPLTSTVPRLLLPPSVINGVMSPLSMWRRWLPEGHAFQRGAGGHGLRV